MLRGGAWAPFCLHAAPPHCSLSAVALRTMRAVALTPPSPLSRPSPLGARAGSTARAPAPPAQVRGRFGAGSRSTPRRLASLTLGTASEHPRHGLGKPSLGLVNQKKHLKPWFVTQNSISLPSVRVTTQIQNTSNYGSSKVTYR